jgi:hypothetical protein
VGVIGALQRGLDLQSRQGQPAAAAARHEAAPSQARPGPTSGRDWSAGRPRPDGRRDFNEFEGQGG